MAMTQNSAITYFGQEGRANLIHVIRVIQRRMKNRPELRQRKLVIFTSYGEGPARAYNMLDEFDPRIIAVTCPPNLVVKQDDTEYRPEIEPKLKKFFNGVGITVLTGRLPFDAMDGVSGHNHDMQTIRNALSMFGGGIVQCVQAVAQACDMGAVEIGEEVIAMSGDWAVLMTASSTQYAFTRDKGMAIQEIFCKPNVFDICRIPRTAPKMIEGEVPAKQLQE